LSIIYKIKNCWIFGFTFCDYIKKHKKFALHFGGKLGKLEKDTVPWRWFLFLRLFTKYIKMKNVITSVYSRHCLGKHDNTSVMTKNSVWPFIISDHWGSLIVGLCHLLWCLSFKIQLVDGNMIKGNKAWNMAVIWSGLHFN
jgi:hypothetical protein